MARDDDVAGGALRERRQRRLGRRAPELGGAANRIAHLSVPTPTPLDRDTSPPGLCPQRARGSARPKTARRQAAVGPLDLVLPSYAAKWARLDEIAVACIARVLRSVGLFLASGEARTTEEVVERLAATETYHGLVGRWLLTLTGLGLLRDDGSRFVSDAPLPVRGRRALVESSRPLFVDFPAPLDYIERCGEQARRRDRRSREPAGDAVSRGSSRARRSALLDVAAGAILECNRARGSPGSWRRPPHPDRPLRVLEIGGGTGGTTAGLLPRLDAARSSRYCFTDIGPLFVAKATRTFRCLSRSCRTASLDIERHPSEQGFVAHEFDVIVAANVLHATKNLHETLDHTAWLLAPGGMLVLCEATRHPPGST